MLMLLLFPYYRDAWFRLSMEIKGLSIIQIISNCRDCKVALTSVVGMSLKCRKESSSSSASARNVLVSLNNRHVLLYSRQIFFGNSKNDRFQVVCSGCFIKRFGGSTTALSGVIGYIKS